MEFLREPKLGMLELHQDSTNLIKAIESKKSLKEAQSLLHSHSDLSKSVTFPDQIHQIKHTIQEVKNWENEYNEFDVGGEVVEDSCNTLLELT